MDSENEDDDGLEYWQTLGQWQQELTADPGYLEWIESLNAQRKENEHGDQRIG